MAVALPCTLGVEGVKIIGDDSEHIGRVADEEASCNDCQDRAHKVRYRLEEFEEVWPVFALSERDELEH